MGTITPIGKKAAHALSVAQDAADCVERIDSMLNTALRALSAGHFGAAHDAATEAVAMFDRVPQDSPTLCQFCGSHHDDNFPCLG